jgi:type I restriction enzyme S subunit
LIRGVTYKKSEAKSAPEDGYLPLLRATNIGSTLNFEELIYVPDSVVKPDQIMVAGDVLIAMSSGSIKVVGKSAPLLEDWEGTFGAFCAVFRAGPKVLPSFVSRFLSSPSCRGRISRLAAGTNINNLKRDHLLTMRIPLPSLAEQRRIVAKLDETLGEIDQFKRNRQAKIEAFDDVKSLMLNDLIQTETGAAREAWPSAPLESLVDVLDSKRVPITKRNRKPGAVPYYGATGVLDWVEGHLFDEPLVLVGEDGAKWGRGERTAFQIDGKSWVNNHAHVLRPIRERVLDAWLVYVLVGMDLTPWISGLTVPKLNQGNLKEIPIPLPPLDDQRRIVATLDEAAAAADSGQSAATKGLELADAMASSLMTDLLTAA